MKILCPKHSFASIRENHFTLLNLKQNVHLCCEIFILKIQENHRHPNSNTFFRIRNRSLLTKHILLTLYLCTIFNFRPKRSPPSWRPLRSMLNPSGPDSSLSAANPSTSRNCVPTSDLELVPVSFHEMFCKTNWIKSNFCPFSLKLLLPLVPLLPEVPLPPRRRRKKRKKNPRKSLTTTWDSVFSIKIFALVDNKSIFWPNSYVFIIFHC